jgi:hypothetical protein
VVVQVGCPYLGCFVAEYLIAHLSLLVLQMAIRSWAWWYRSGSSIKLILNDTVLTLTSSRYTYGHYFIFITSFHVLLHGQQQFTKGVCIEVGEMILN